MEAQGEFLLPPFSFSCIADAADEQTALLLRSFLRLPLFQMWKGVHEMARPMPCVQRLEYH